MDQSAQPPPSPSLSVSSVSSSFSTLAPAPAPSRSSAKPERVTLRSSPSPSPPASSSAPAVSATTAAAVAAAAVAAATAALQGPQDSSDLLLHNSDALIKAHGDNPAVLPHSTAAAIPNGPPAVPAVAAAAAAAAAAAQAAAGGGPLAPPAAVPVPPVVTTATTHAQDSNPYQFITLNQSPRSRTSRNYVLKLRQQPKHSRMCGFGEKVDRRPLDPPPIIVCSFVGFLSFCFPANLTHTIAGLA
ncbi:hypothetical protein BDZ88DRAFT_31823 [Geranomyces variabilis]|nr:hypothetical protein BDZ88DRAFT_31823 [Geranomyces variabilis]